MEPIVIPAQKPTPPPAKRSLNRWWPVFVILLIVVSLPVVFYLSQQSQEIREEAAIVEYPPGHPLCPSCQGSSNSACGTCRQNGCRIDDVTGEVVENWCLPICNSVSSVCSFNCPDCSNATTCYPANTPRPSPSPRPSSSPQPNPVCNSNCNTTSDCRSSEICYFEEGQTIGACRNPSCTNEPSCQCQPSPTPTTAQCVDLRVYQVTGTISDPASWQQVTPGELSSLQPGDVIYITTLGATPSGTFDRARIRVNSDVWTIANETTLKKPGSDEFYITYTIPSDGTVNFSFGAEVHEQTLDRWF